ncbi:hypothetical protein BCR36DRAFT_410977 [Piromyces finnis]|uniref:Uncharacterized protein n=1 Tax=Piromyces finnis TaxID=1754191 RepID=A0A1Y1VF44_9FUNG|nr:hypothetical protein BCR36DRAFT_410977 [Piromyces finnis]|eukprot:ORX53822.1 hypothetical protein BCR36DRAFT_410977 [Piromyces finnis]
MYIIHTYNNISSPNSQKQKLNINAILYHTLYEINAIDIIVKNTDESKLAFIDSLPVLSSYNEGVNFYFPEPYYSFYDYSVYGVNIDNRFPISFISTSENKTIFDYGKLNRFSLSINNNDISNGKVYFEGIIFKDYYSIESVFFIINT